MFLINKGKLINVKGVKVFKFIFWRMFKSNGKS